MGGSVTKQQKMEILNDTKVKNSLKKFNETINETFLETVQTQTQNVSQSMNLKQSVGSGNRTEVGDIELVIENVEQEASSKGDLTALQKSEVQQEVANKTLNDMQTKLTEMMDMSQGAQNKKDEQMITGLLNAISDTVGGAAAMATGGSYNTNNEQKIHNLLNVENSTELRNKVKNSISQKMVNDTISNIASSANVSQEVGSDNRTKIGNIRMAISGVKQKITVEMATKAISESGTGSSIIAALANVEKSDIERVVKTDQKGQNVETGTFQGLGEMFRGNATMMIVSVVASSLIAGVGMFALQMQGGGSKRTSNFLQNLVQRIKKMDSMTLIVIAIAVIFVYLIPTIVYKEHFTETIPDVYLKVGDKYVNNNLCLKNEATEANEVQRGNAINLGDNKVLFQFKDSKALAVEADNLVRADYDAREVDKYTFDVKDGKMSQNGKHIGIQDNCLILDISDTNAAVFKFAI